MGHWERCQGWLETCLPAASEEAPAAETAPRKRGLRVYQSRLLRRAWEKCCTFLQLPECPLHVCGCGLRHLPPCKSPSLLIKQLQFPRVHFLSSHQPATGSGRGCRGAAMESSPAGMDTLLQKGVSNPEGKSFQVTLISSKESMKSLKVHRVNSPHKQHHGCCAKQKIWWLSGKKEAMCCRPGGAVTSMPCSAALRLPVASAGFSLLLCSLTFVHCIIGLISEHGRSANGLEVLKDRWKAIWLVP